MANYISLTIYQGPTDSVPLASTITRQFSASAVQQCYADANTGVSGVNTKVELALGEGNGQKTGIYLVSQTAASIASSCGLTALTVYQNFDGTTPSGGSIAKYFSPSTVQKYYADANTGVSDVNTQVELRLKKGNGTETGTILVSQTVTTINASIGNGGTSGTATLVAGTVTVANTNITANSIILLSVKTIGGTAGTLSYTLTAGTGFTINSSSSSDTSTVAYSIIY